MSHQIPSRVGVLLVNLGTPDEPTAPAVRRYLREFLWDRRVVEVPRPVWWLILNGIILNTRPAKTAKKYQGVWMPEGSPLRVYTEKQTIALRAELSALFGDGARVEYAMRYGNPSVHSQLQALTAEGCDQILVLPLYPQYAASTTASVMDAVSASLGSMRNVPGLRVVRSFHDHPAYIDAVAANVEAHWARIGRPDFSTDRLLITFHGVPRFHLDRGDPYHCLCHKSARLICERLGLAPGQAVTTFQSRFGRAEWLQPYTDETLTRLGAEGVKRVDVICPGFAADCLETLEEIADEGKESFIEAGGETFNYLPVANDTAPFVKALTTVALENLGGWLPRPPQTQDDLAARAARARAMGAKD